MVKPPSNTFENHYIIFLSYCPPLIHPKKGLFSETENWSTVSFTDHQVFELYGFWHLIKITKISVNRTLWYSVGGVNSTVSCWSDMHTASPNAQHHKHINTVKRVGCCCYDCDRNLDPHPTKVQFVTGENMVLWRFTPKWFESDWAKFVFHLSRAFHQ